MDTRSPAQAALDVFRQHGGTLHTQEALRQGIHPRTLYALRDSGKLQRLSRGLYRLADLPPLSNPDLVIVAHKLPQAIVCLVSALAFHKLTMRVPQAIDVALRSQSGRPVLDYPPLRTFWFSGSAWSEGVEFHQLDGVSLRIYGPAKSVADCFKYRRKIGLDVALEALWLYCRRGDFQMDTLLKYARICRVERVIRPYLEMLLDSRSGIEADHGSS
jgi:predicted transcriptional regulator of viral defense system